MTEYEAAEQARKFADYVTKGEPEATREDCHTYAMAGFLQGWSESQRSTNRKVELLSRINTELQGLRS